MIQSRREFLTTARNGLLLGIIGESVTSFAASVDQDPEFSPSNFSAYLLAERCGCSWAKEKWARTSSLD